MARTEQKDTGEGERIAAFLESSHTGILPLVIGSCPILKKVMIIAGSYPIELRVGSEQDLVWTMRFQSAFIRDLS